MSRKERVHVRVDTNILRCDLFGSLPQYPSQTDFSGTPILLSPEEIHLLYKKGVLRLVDGNAAQNKPSRTDVESFISGRNEDFERQQQQMLGFKKEKAQLFSQSNSKKRKVESDEQSIVDTKYLDEIKGNEHILIQSEPKIDNIDVAPVTWTYPSTEEERHRYMVFEDLWNKGLYLTKGSKFGGDFLAYLGDPLQFHAHYVIIVKFPHEEITPLDLISYGRLGVTVKKTPVLASIFGSDQIGNPIVSYYSIDWQGVT